ncbi:MAG: Uma2 family endonuclease [Cyanobacteria bacterium CRU_2_1]|nr:Uma2 family endonuclease [Cyanobacteria bacterium RU_5_0]NJR60508.1 Uma2 family endonuclease [Cyanobacteria bacterium CRU_2_1]
MVQYKPPQFLPTEEDLPDNDDTPVDNELHVLMPNLLRALLVLNWADRTDWFLGINMGLYYDPEKPAIIPDGFLSLGIPRFRASGKLRLSYLIWQENILPKWVLEIVSQTPGGEYTDKMSKYAAIGILYYTIYNPDYGQRDKHDSFEVYRLANDRYVRQLGNPVWMPEIGLGIGSEQGTHEGCAREWLYWYNQQGDRFPAPENLIAQERQRAEAAEQQLEQERRLLEQERRLREELLERLRQRGINPEAL